MFSFVRIVCQMCAEYMLHMIDHNKKTHVLETRKCIYAFNVQNMFYIALHCFTSVVTRDLTKNGEILNHDCLNMYLEFVKRK